MTFYNLVFLRLPLKYMKKASRELHFTESIFMRRPAYGSLLLAQRAGRAASRKDESFLLDFINGLFFKLLINGIFQFFFFHRAVFSVDLFLKRS